MKNNFSLVTIVILCRNEERFIADCLDSFIAQSSKNNKIEILVIDGMSEDKTREIVAGYSKKYSFVRLLDNPNKTAPHAINLGIKNSKGNFVVIAGAHAKYEPEYIVKCLKYLEEYKADVVGGCLKTIPKKDTLRARAIALSLASVFGAGNANFRLGVEKPVFVDTVFGGCYKKEVFEKVGLFNENLTRSQDMEFAQRMKRAGIKILLAPDITAYYYPKDTLSGFFKHNIKDGIWAIYPLKFVKTPLKLRHYIPLVFVLTLPLSIWPYILAALYFSAGIAVKEKDARLFFVLPVVFFVRHFAYGFGSVMGIVKLFVEKNR